ncbi:MAG: CAAX amino terminal protease self- immunity [Methanomassiliicoccales archaeon PtaU1.Bin124]|nr:MAG: CAAX amino terminal protease self- immunity [Methanomassiliicoccales archaeon PtaU1.Bin124]
MYPPPYAYFDRETPFQKFRRYTSIATAWLILVLVLECILNIGLMIWGTTIVFPETSSHTYPIFIIVPWLIVLHRIGGIVLAGFYVFLASAIIISFLYMGRESFKPFLNELRGKMPEKGHSPLFVTATLMFATVFFTYLVYIVAEIAGIGITTPDFDQSLWALLLSLAGASVWEEIVSRVMLIGLPLLVIHLATKKMRSPKRYLLGGGFELGKLEIALLLFSSLMFSLAHLSSWDAVKLIPTFASGLALGYLFIRYGLYASIMLHFFVDYLNMPYYAAGKSVSSGVAIGLLEIAIIIIGLACFIYYLLRIYDFMGDKGLVKKASPAPVMYSQGQQNVAPPPAQNEPPITYHGQVPAFVCKQCGGTQARYDNGALFCTRCGKKD